MNTMIDRFGFMRLSSAFFLIITLVSCNLDDGNTINRPSSNIVEVASNIGQLSSFVAALDRANLTTILQTTGGLTVLAPSDAAFGNFLSQQGFANLEAVPAETLEQILLNHVILGQIDSSFLSNLQRNYLETLAEGPTTGSKVALYFDATNDIFFNGASKVIDGDVLAANGIIHIVDAVIPIPTLDTFISVDDNFEDLNSALDIITPISDIPEGVKDGGPFTVFAPTNLAFDNLLATNTAWNSVGDIDEDLLAAVIAHHVLAGNIRSADISSGETATTLEGDTITFNTVNGNLEITDGSGNTGALVVFVDIQASNGVIHVLADQVLLPDTGN
ncbi:MAG: fasciclin domain-containing protein [Flavobacteriaceae bacterium]